MPGEKVVGSWVGGTDAGRGVGDRRCDGQAREAGPACCGCGCGVGWGGGGGEERCGQIWRTLCRVGRCLLVTFGVCVVVVAVWEGVKGCGCWGEPVAG